MMRENRIVNKLSAWYFSKKVLPYWAILLMDALIMFVSVVFTYWVANRSAMTFEHRTQLFYTAVMFAVLGLVGARMFRTYAGVLRYSGTVDLIKLAYANCVTYVLAMCASLAAEYFGVEELCALSPKAVFMAVMVATLLMWASRLAVKTLYESVSVAPRAKRVLIFGTMSGGVGLAKYILSQGTQEKGVAIAYDSRIMSDVFAKQTALVLAHWLRRARFARCSLICTSRKAVKQFIPRHRFLSCTCSSSLVWPLA